MQKLGIKYGIICGLVYVVFGLGNLLLGSSGSTNAVLPSLLGIAMFVATFFVIFYGVKDYRDNVNGGRLQVGEAVKLGTLIALIGALIAAVFIILYHKVIDPEYMDRYMATMEEVWEESGMSDEQMEQTKKWTSMFKSPFLTAGFTIVWYCLWGLVKGLISGAILKREPIPSV